MDVKSCVVCIKFVVFDIDGVMIDGGLYYIDDGGELKIFNVQDGFGFKLMQCVGIELVIVIGWIFGVVVVCVVDFGIEYVYQGVVNKCVIVGGLLEKFGLNWFECVFMGDDLIDLLVMM